jgi:hypothetical protein
MSGTTNRDDLPGEPMSKIRTPLLAACALLPLTASRSTVKDASISVPDTVGARLSAAAWFKRAAARHRRPSRDRVLLADLDRVSRMQNDGV